MSDQLPERTEEQKSFDEMFFNAVEHRKKSCFWDDGDWEDRWELQSEYALPRSEELVSDRYRSNVRSPEISGRIQSAMHKLSAMNIEFVVRPKNSAAKLAARVDELIVNHFFQQENYRSVLRDAFYTAIVHGAAPIGVEWLKKTRKVRQVIRDPEEMDDKQKKKVKKGELVYADVEMVDVNAPVLIHYPLPNVFLDPGARNMQGQVFNCGHAFVAELMTKEAFDNEFKDKKGYKNVDKVEAITKDYIAPEGRQVNPGKYLYPDIDQEGDYVYVVWGWDYYNDQYKVRANDIYIKETPLPYADKKIPLEILKPYVLPNHVYGAGMVDLLIPSVYQLELIQNAFYDYIIYTTNPVLLVQRGDYGDFSRKYEVVNGEPGSLLPVSDTGASVQALKYPGLGVDIYQGITSLQKDAILASQHDPNQLGVIQKDSTATANLINKEVSEAFANYIVMNVTSGLENICSMLISRIHEFMTRPQASKLVNGELENGEPFEVAIPGKYVNIDWDERTVRVENNPERVSVVTINDDLYRMEDEDGELVQVTPNDYEIVLSPESKKIMSRALEQQKLMDAMKILMPYAVNPADTQRSQMNPLPLVNAVELVDQFTNAYEISPKILLNRTENEKRDIQKAQEQNMEMYEGKRSMPHAGEPASHVQVHTEFQNMLINQLENLRVDIESSINAGMEIDENSKKEFDSIQKTLPLLSEHIDLDTVLVADSAMMASNMGKAASQQGQQPPQTPQGTGAGPGQQMTESGPGADHAMPNMPQQAGMTQGGAGPLTKM